MATMTLASTPTPTPTDAWSSYFDSWQREDQEVPAFEPIILDDEHYTQMNVNDIDMDIDLDWDMNRYSPLIMAPNSACSNKGKSRLGIHTNLNPNLNLSSNASTDDVDIWLHSWLGNNDNETGGGMYGRLGPTPGQSTRIHSLRRRSTPREWSLRGLKDNSQSQSQCQWRRDKPEVSITFHLLLNDPRNDIIGAVTRPSFTLFLYL
jgi:hypothetical protein